jgi:hypothetical protein
MHYTESSNTVVRWECTLQNAWRKDAAHCMGKLEEIVAVFEEINEVKETNHNCHGCSHTKQNSAI